MKAGIQELLSGERVGTVRRALAMAAATMARICVPANQWPSLLPWLHGCTQSPSEAQRETALMLICSLIETIGALPSYNLCSRQLSQPKVVESMLKATHASAARPRSTCPWLACKRGGFAWDTSSPNSPLRADWAAAPVMSTVMRECLQFFPYALQASTCGSTSAPWCKWPTPA